MWCQAYLNILALGLNKVCEGPWESEKTEDSSEQVMKDLARGVGEVQVHYTEIHLSFLANWI